MIQCKDYDVDRNPEQKYKVLGKDKLSVTVTDEQEHQIQYSFKLKKVKQNKSRVCVWRNLYYQL